MECQINDQINNGNNIDARKAIIYSLIVVWFKYINQDATEFCNFVYKGSNNFIKFELTIDANSAKRAAELAAEYATNLASSAANSASSSLYLVAKYAKRAAEYATSAFAKDIVYSAAEDACSAAYFAKYAALYASSAYFAKYAHIAIYAEELAKSADSANSAIYYLIAAYIYLI